MLYRSGKRHLTVRPWLLVISLMFSFSAKIATAWVVDEPTANSLKVAFNSHFYFLKKHKRQFTYLAKRNLKAEEMAAEERFTEQIQIEKPKWNKDEVALRNAYEASIKRYLM
ncbi:MAG: hypothetical protein HRU09_13445 [Oligoflexales bacterium]|nr:hypothetical protein [Oligoflexales bacterium]